MEVSARRVLERRRIMPSTTPLLLTGWGHRHDMPSGLVHRPLVLCDGLCENRGLVMSIHERMFINAAGTHCEKAYLIERQLLSCPCRRPTSRKTRSCTRGSKEQRLAA